MTLLRYRVAKRLTKRPELGPPELEPSGGLMPTKTNQVRRSGGERVEQAKASRAANGSAPCRFAIRVLEAHDRNGFAVIVCQPAGDDAYDAVIPTTLAEYDRGLLGVTFGVYQ